MKIEGRPPPACLLDGYRSAQGAFTTIRYEEACGEMNGFTTIHYELPIGVGTSCPSEVPLSTLRYYRDEAWRISIHCAGRVGLLCAHAWHPSWDQLIQYFGLEFDLCPETRRMFLDRFRCSECGSHPHSLIITTRSGYEQGGPWNVHGENPGGYRNDAPEDPGVAKYRRLLAEQNRIDELWRRAAREREERMRAERKAREVTRKAIDEARERGEFLIGPPSPHKFKKGRPPMKG